VLRAIDRAIPLPIVFQLHHGQRTRMVAAYKRPSAAEAGKWVIDSYFAGAWQPADAARVPLPIALDLHSLYEQLLRSLLPQAARPGESLPEQAGTTDPAAQPAERVQQAGSPPAQGKTVQPQGGAQCRIARTQDHEIDQLA
jgi:hypothetical protein